ncbi:MAG: SAM domain-containing protein, partial [Rhodopila sp.]
MDTGDWLKSLGLERYEAAFRANDVTVELLPILTADDLRDIGVTSVGHRRRILDAIAPLRLVRIPDPTLVEVSSDPG